MGGAIGVNSTPGSGSTFWIELPREIRSATDRQRFEPPQPKLANPQWQTACAPRHRVLYIEDNPANRALLTQALRRQSGVTLLTAPNGELGVELALTQRPDLILLDINLPDLGGYEVLARLRADPLSAEVPVFAVTANALAADIQRGREAGFAEYLTKPIDVNQLRALLDLYLKFKE
jgi:CheY-like chemotaxis protein